jgi:tetratricopeptide (TPR) repeat protein
MLGPVQDYSLRDVARILKVSPRRLRYWQKTQLVDASAPGELREGYAFRDLVCLRTVVSLLEQGVPLQRIRRSLEALRDRDPEFDDPVKALRLLDPSSDRLVVKREGRLEETGGQLLLEFDRRAEATDHEDASAVAVLADVPRREGGREGSRVGTQGFGAHGSMADSTLSAMEWFERGCELDADPASWDEAIGAYERAIELAADYADAYCNLGAVRYNKGQRDEAREAFAACLGYESDHIEANFNLANVLEEQGEDELALAHYRRALTADPLYPDLHINLALLYEKLRRRGHAIGHWRRYLQLDPKGSWAEVARLRIERGEGETERPLKSRPTGEFSEG